MKGLFKRLAAWLVRHGLEELQKELPQVKEPPPTDRIKFPR